MTHKNRKVTIPVSIGYGLTDIMGGGAFTVIGAWLLFFYTTFVGLSPIEAASIVAIAYRGCYCQPVYGQLHGPFL